MDANIPVGAKFVDKIFEIKTMTSKPFHEIFDISGDGTFFAKKGRHHDKISCAWLIKNDAKK